MPLFSKPQLEEDFRRRDTLQKSATSIIINEAISKAKNKGGYDIFLSHRHADINNNHLAELVSEIKEMGYSVGVARNERPALSRQRITAEGGEYLRDLMNRCRCLLYVVTERSAQSIWMPWELGYCDGKHGRVAIVRIQELLSKSESYPGPEDLGLYPYVTKTKPQKEDRYELRINRTADEYVDLRSWLKGGLPKSHRPAPHRDKLFLLKSTPPQSKTSAITVLKVLNEAMQNQKRNEPKRSG